MSASVSDLSSEAFCEIAAVSVPLNTRCPKRVYVVRIRAMGGVSVGLLPWAPTFRSVLVWENCVIPRLSAPFCSFNFSSWGDVERSARCCATSDAVTTAGEDAKAGLKMTRRGRSLLATWLLPCLLPAYFRCVVWQETKTSTNQNAINWISLEICMRFFHSLYFA